jgi:serine/threonine protein phosphatase 1
MRFFCISDIHGQLDAFNKLLKKINLINEYNNCPYKIILLGDYVDRGSDSKGVVDKIMHLHDNGAIILKGNHEEMFIDWIDKKRDTISWFKNGGYNTLLSYGYEISDDTLDFIREDFIHKYYEHYIFLKTLPIYYDNDEYIFVHAGINPAHINWKKTSDHNFLWIRELFYKFPHDFKQTVIFGHTNTKDLGMEYNDIWFSDKKIGIDGGASNGYGYNLNCLEINNGKFREHYVKIN